MIHFSRIHELVALAEKQQKNVSDIVWQFEADRSQRSLQNIWQDMVRSLAVMREAVASGLESTNKSASGLVGGDAQRVFKRFEAKQSLSGNAIARATAYALAVSEVNAGMGRIVACPTAGSCGIIPGAIMAAAEELKSNDEDLIRGLFTSAGIGMVIAEHASIAGAEGGCQAECGSAAAMAAGAIAEMAGGTPRQISAALTLALKNSLGLVCDPVAGLVEVPCVKRNAFYAAHAMVAADMALAGVESIIPADEVIDAMYQIGRAIPKELRETSQGGLAVTPTALEIQKRLYGEK
jgi:L-serine dehydratase